jgi:hypothetical protein
LRKLRLPDPKVVLKFMRSTPTMDEAVSRAYELDRCAR